MLLWQDPFWQVSYERDSLILRGKHVVALFFIYGQMASFTLGLNLIRLLAHARPVEARSLQPSVQANLLAEPTSPTVHFF